MNKNNLENFRIFKLAFKRNLSCLLQHVKIYLDTTRKLMIFCIIFFMPVSVLDARHKLSTKELKSNSIEKETDSILLICLVHCYY